MVAACGGDDGGGGNDGGETNDDALLDVAAETGETLVTIAEMTPAELCAHVWTRLTNCGHFYTYPRFPEVCATFDDPQITTLRECAQHPCPDLVTCIQPLYGTPGQ